MAAGDAFTFTRDTAVYHDGPLSMSDNRKGPHANNH
jgi:hypothetical protein